MKMGTQNIRVLTATAVLGALTAVAVISPAGAAPGHTPQEQVLAVTANIEEAFAHGNDLDSMQEIPVFVRKVLNDVPFLPDVVMLQEVRARSASYAAKVFTRKSGDKYIVAKQAGVSPTKDYSNKQVHKETAILLNSETMKIADSGDYVATSYPQSATSSSHKNSTKKHAFLLAEKREGGLRVALASIHLAPESYLKNRELSNSYRRDWVKKIHNKVSGRYSDADMKILAGDFNKIRCHSGSFRSCQVSKFWKYLVGAPRNYSDSLWELKEETGVDYLFTKDKPVKGRQGPAGSYSDHRFHWALIKNK
jgi:exonuclease III